MGRRSLRIERLESMKARQSKFCLRKAGLLRKANELSTLCGVDIALLVFSPTREPSLYVGQNKELSNVLERLSAMTLDSREKRRAYTMKMLDKAYLEKAGLQVDPRHKTVEGHWKNLENITDLAKLKTMEDHLIARLAKIKEMKIQLQQENQS